MSSWALSSELCRATSRLWAGRRRGWNRTPGVWRRSCHKPKGGGMSLRSEGGSVWVFVLIKNPALTLKCPMIQNRHFPVFCGAFALSFSTADLKNIQQWSWWISSFVISWQCHEKYSKKESVASWNICLALTAPLGLRGFYWHFLSPHQEFPTNQEYDSHFTET